MSGGMCDESTARGTILSLYLERLVGKREVTPSNITKWARYLSRVYFMYKNQFEMLVGFRTKSLNNRLKELPDTFKDEDLWAWCDVFTSALRTVDGRLRQLKEKNVIGVHDFLSSTTLDAEWANWSSSWLSSRDALAFANEHPDMPIASSGIGDMLQLARDGYRGFHTASPLAFKVSKVQFPHKPKKNRKITK